MESNWTAEDVRELVQAARSIAESLAWLRVNAEEGERRREEAGREAEAHDRQMVARFPHLAS